MKTTLKSLSCGQGSQRKVVLWERRHTCFRGPFCCEQQGADVQPHPADAATYAFRTPGPVQPPDRLTSHAAEAKSFQERQVRSAEPISILLSSPRSSFPLGTAQGAARVRPLAGFPGSMRRPLISDDWEMTLRVPGHFLEYCLCLGRLNES